MSLIEELKRRNVIRVATGYVVTSWLIIQVVETLFPIYELSNENIRYIISALVIGFVPVVILAWVFEWTSDGIRKDANVDRAKSNNSANKIDGVIIVILVVAVSYFALDKFVFTNTSSELVTESSSETITSKPAIAVLAFRDMSQDQDQAYMSDGIAEEILNLLAKIPELRVISRSSSFSFRDKEQVLPIVASELNVTYILEGSVRKSGNQIRITTQLVDAINDTQRWSETYDRKLESIFEIQDDIAARVVEQLKIKVLGALPVSKRIDQEAYTLVLKARYLWNRRASGDEEEALSLYQRAVEIDPNYAQAWTGLSVAYFGAGRRGRLPRDEAKRLSRQAIDKAVALDPDSPETRIRLGQTYSREQNYSAMFEQYQKAMELAPENPLVLGVNALQAVLQGDIDRTVELYNAASENDPLGAIYHGNKAASLIGFQRLDEAEVALEENFRLNANTKSYNNLKLNILLHRRKYVEAQALLLEMPKDDMYLPQYAMVYAGLGQTEQYEEIMDKLINNKDLFAQVGVAQVYAFLGENDLAFEWLENTRPEVGPWIIAYDGYIRYLTTDPRWETYVDSLDWPWEYKY